MRINTQELADKLGDFIAKEIIPATNTNFEAIMFASTIWVIKNKGNEMLVEFSKNPWVQKLQLSTADGTVETKDIYEMLKFACETVGKMEIPFSKIPYIGGMISDVTIFPRHIDTIFKDIV